MAQTGKGNNAEKVFASAISVPMNIVIGLADLLIAKDVISREEMVSLLQRLADHSPKHGEHEDHSRTIQGVRRQSDLPDATRRKLALDRS
jgi:hypothetical protein